MHFFQKSIKLLKWNNKSRKPSIILNEYVSKKGVTISGIQRFLKKKSTTTFDETSLGEIICEMQQNGEIDGKFKIMNPIYDDKNFAEDLSKLIRKLFIQKNQSMLH